MDQEQVDWDAAIIGLAERLAVITDSKDLLSVQSIRSALHKEVDWWLANPDGPNHLLDHPKLEVKV